MLRGSFDLPCVPNVIQTAMMPTRLNSGRDDALPTSRQQLLGALWLGCLAAREDHVIRLIRPGTNRATQMKDQSTFLLGILRAELKQTLRSNIVDICVFVYKMRQFSRIESAPANS